MYQNLDPARIVATAETLGDRIAERFPGSGLSRVAAELGEVCREAADLSCWLARPNLWLRAAVGLALLVLLGVLAGALANLDFQLAFSSLSDFFQGVEAAVNDAVFLGVAVFFLVTWETRRKRARALKALHVLRSMAHIVDMHQLTKDPERVMGAGVDTPSSPRRVMSPFELTRYLDYCTEMLSLLSKVAALYVQRFNDPVTLAAVNEVESLTSGLARKIWQKLVILDRMVGQDVPGDPAFRGESAKIGPASRDQRLASASPVSDETS